jgi:hypothetical protein
MVGAGEKVYQTSKKHERVSRRIRVGGRRQSRRLIQGRCSRFWMVDRTRLTSAFSRSVLVFSKVVRVMSHHHRCSVNDISEKSFLPDWVMLNMGLLEDSNTGVQPPEDFVVNRPKLLILEGRSFQNVPRGERRSPVDRVKYQCECSAPIWITSGGIVSGKCKEYESSIIMVNSLAVRRTFVKEMHPLILR